MNESTLIGIDIAKSKFHIAACAGSRIKSKVFANNTEGFAELIHWLAGQGIERAACAMEATGTYYEALATFLAEAGFTVFVVNPARIKAYAQSSMSRSKTDKADARTIVQFLLSRSERLHPWQPLPKELRTLRDLVRRLEALKDLRQQEANRVETASDPHVLASLKIVIDTLDEQIAEIERRIRQHFDDHPGLKTQRELLESIPGLGETTVRTLLAELPFHRFECAAQAAAFAGTTPALFESGSSVRGRPRMSQVGCARLRRALYFPAIAASRHNPPLRQFYQRLLAAGKSKMAALGAVMRKLIHVAYGVLSSGQPFNPDFLVREHTRA